VLPRADRVVGPYNDEQLTLALVRQQLIAISLKDEKTDPNVGRARSP
jgi:hypothetical protein